jgi:hypothetical protein
MDETFKEGRKLMRLIALSMKPTEGRINFPRLKVNITVYSGAVPSLISTRKAGILHFLR